MAPLVVTDAIVVEWIEMRLRAQRRMAVHVRKLALEVAFAPREELRTEISASSPTIACAPTSRPPGWCCARC
jgi:uncharacterized SAM-dependent methyltransferase